MTFNESHPRYMNHTIWSYDESHDHKWSWSRADWWRSRGSLHNLCWPEICNLRSSSWTSSHIKTYGEWLGPSGYFSRYSSWGRTSVTVQKPSRHPIGQSKSSFWSSKPATDNCWRIRSSSGSWEAEWIQRRPLCDEFQTRPSWIFIPFIFVFH